VVLLERLQLVGGNTDARPLLYHEEHGKQLLHGGYHQVHEIPGYGYEAAGEIVGALALLHDLLGQDDTQHAFPHFILLQIESKLAPASPTDGKASRIQSGRICGEGNIFYIIEDSEIIADKINHRQMLYSGDIDVAYLFCIHYCCVLPANIKLFAG